MNKFFNKYVVAVLALVFVVTAVFKSHTASPKQVTLDVTEKTIPFLVRTQNNDTTIIDSPQPINNKFDVVTKKKSVTKLKLNPERTISLLGVVESTTVTPVINAILQMQNSTDPIYLVLNSPGGSVLDGNTLVSIMETSKAPIHTVCLQLCASMAFTIFEYGKTRYVMDRSIIMAHPAATMAMGNLEQILNRINAIKRLIDKDDAFIAGRAGLKLEQFKNLLANEFWIDGEDAVNSHFADQLVSFEFPVGSEGLVLSNNVSAITPDVIKELKK